MRSSRAEDRTVGNDPGGGLWWVYDPRRWSPYFRFPLASHQSLFAHLLKRCREMAQIARGETFFASGTAFAAGRSLELRDFLTGGVRSPSAACASPLECWKPAWAGSSRSSMLVKPSGFTNRPSRIPGSRARTARALPAAASSWEDSCVAPVRPRRSKPQPPTFVARSP